MELHYLWARVDNPFEIPQVVIVVNDAATLNGNETEVHGFPDPEPPCTYGTT